MDFNKRSAFELAQDLKEKKFSSYELTHFYIEQIKKWNPRLNAIVEDRFSEALEQAKQCDEALSLGKPETRAPLYGVPITVKEMFAVEGLHCTGGSIHQKNSVAEADATAITRVKNAGAIILGTTNVPELGFWFECENPVYGATKNPYDTRRTCGGSSGGEAAILGAGASPLGIGSDVGGSIRMPAAFCGVFGLKPSEKWIPLTGHFPFTREYISVSSGNRYPFTVIGPMARSARDLAPLFQILMGKDQWDPETTDHHLNNEPISWKGRKVFVLASPKIFGLWSVEEDLRIATLKAAKHFESLGAEIVELPRDIFKKTFQLWSARSLYVEERSFVSQLTNDQGFQFIPELAKWAWALVRGERPNYQFISLITAVAELTGGSKKTIVAQQMKELHALRADLTARLGTENILLMPPHPRKAPKLGSTLIRPMDFCYTAIFNATGFPASVSPMGLSQDGLPLAVQVAAATDQDHLCLRAAEELERAFGGWVPPRDS